MCRASSICKRDQQVDLATTCETCHRHDEGLSHWLASLVMSSWRFLETCTCWVRLSPFRTLLTGVSGTEDFFFFESGKKAILGGTTSDDEDVRDSFQRTDFKLVRTAAFSNKTLWDTLTSNSCEQRMVGLSRTGNREPCRTTRDVALLILHADCCEKAHHSFAQPRPSLLHVTEIGVRRCI